MFFRGIEKTNKWRKQDREMFFQKEKQLNLDKGTKERKTLKNITDR